MPVEPYSRANRPDCEELQQRVRDLEQQCGLEIGLKVSAEAERDELQRQRDMLLEYLRKTKKFQSGFELNILQYFIADHPGENWAREWVHPQEDPQ